METKDSAWIYTYTGKKLHPLDANEKEICIRDIAHALSLINRFTGHSIFPYSVAQHSVLVSQHCNPEDALAGLLHDGSEYALNDVSTPLKRSGKFEDYRKYEHKLQTTIYKKFGAPEVEPPSVKEADLVLLSTEARDLLMQPLDPEWILPRAPLEMRIIPLDHKEAEALFLHRFAELVSKEDFIKWIKE